MKVIKVEILLRGPPLPTGYIDLKRNLKDIPMSLVYFPSKVANAHHFSTATLSH